MTVSDIRSLPDFGSIEPYLKVVASASFEEYEAMPFVLEWLVEAARRERDHVAHITTLRREVAVVRKDLLTLRSTSA